MIGKGKRAESVLERFLFLKKEIHRKTKKRTNPFTYEFIGTKPSPRDFAAATTA